MKKLYILFSLVSLSVVIMSLSKCNGVPRIPNDINIANPLDPSQVKSSIENFSKAYIGTHNPNKKSIKLEAKWTDIVQYLDYGSLELTQDTGIAIYYLLHNEQLGSDTSFGLIITKATIHISGILQPVLKPNQQNLLMLNSNGTDSFPINKLFDTSNYYLNSLKVIDDYPTSIVHEVVNLNHPKACFYPGLNFHKFISDNMNAVSDIGNLFLTFKNGTQLKDNILNHLTQRMDTLNVQVPIIILEEEMTSGQRKTLLNNRNLDPDKPYLYKALDVGRLCPPDC